MYSALNGYHNQTINTADFVSMLENVLRLENQGSWKDEVSSSYFSYTKLCYVKANEIVSFAHNLIEIYKSIDFDYSKKVHKQISNIESELHSL